MGETVVFQNFIFVCLFSPSPAIIIRDLDKYDKFDIALSLENGRTRQVGVNYRLRTHA